MNVGLVILNFLIHQLREDEMGNLACTPEPDWLRGGTDHIWGGRGKEVYHPGVVVLSEERNRRRVRDYEAHEDEGSDRSSEPEDDGLNQEYLLLE